MTHGKPDRTDAEAAGVGDRATLVGAAAGDAGSWAELVRRYSSLITAVARRYRLDAASVDDVRQTVWMRCFTHVRALRDPGALPGWLRTMANREALRMSTAQRRSTTVDPADLEWMLADDDAAGDPSDGALRTEATQAVREGLAELTPAQSRLLVLLHSDTRVPYQELSRTLGMPTGSIGPNRSRYLAKLRHTAALQRYLSPLDESA